VALPTRAVPLVPLYGSSEEEMTIDELDQVDDF